MAASRRRGRPVDFDDIERSSRISVAARAFHLEEIRLRPYTIKESVNKCVGVLVQEVLQALLAIRLELPLVPVLFQERDDVLGQRARLTVTSASGKSVTRRVQTEMASEREQRRENRIQ